MRGDSNNLTTMFQVLNKMIERSPLRLVRSLATTVEASGNDRASKLHNLRKSLIDEGRAHFRVGDRRIYFPTARVVLLRPNAKHTPYQAKFIVPKGFNKLDLRDYLYHIYGLRALSITTQLMHSKFERSLPLPFRPRHRTPQVKKMTVTMLEPFVWPNDEESVRLIESEMKLKEENEQYSNDHSRVGSDKLRRSTLFGGIIDPEPAPTNFVPKKLNRKMHDQKVQDLSNSRKFEDVEIIKKYLDKSL